MPAVALAFAPPPPPPVFEVLVTGRRSEEMIRRGAALRELRQETGRSAAEVARFVDLSVEGYRMYEKGYVKIRQEWLPKLSQAFGLPVAVVSRRLDLPLFTESVPALDLAESVAAVLGPEHGKMLDQIVAELAGLPDSDQRMILEGIQDQIRGRKRRPPSAS